MKCIYKPCQQQATIKGVACYFEHWVYHRAIQKGDPFIANQHIKNLPYNYPIYWHNLRNGISIEDLAFYMPKEIAETIGIHPFDFNS